MAVAKLRVFRVVLASPADVETEWRLVEKLIGELNQGLAPELNLILRLSTWKTDAYAGFHPQGSQGLIDATLKLETADVLLGLFWTRFGTPVFDASSGTEHEIRRAVQYWRDNGLPNVMVYFKEAPYNPKTKDELEQWMRVRDFRSSFPQGGLYRSYITKPQLETQLRRDLTNLLRAEYGRTTKKQSPRRTNRRVIEAAEPPPYTAEFLTIPRSQRDVEHTYTLNVMLSNFSTVKLTDYDIELVFPAAFLSGERSVSIDEDISTPDRAIFRVPMPPHAAPPPVFPGQTRNVLSVAFAIRPDAFDDDAALLHRVTSTIRFGDGRLLKMDTPIDDLHDAESNEGRMLLRERPVGRSHRMMFSGDATSSEAFNPLNYGPRRRGGGPTSR